MLFKIDSNLGLLKKMVIFELFEVLTVRYSLKIYFQVLTGDLRIKLPLDGMWSVKR